MAQKFTVGGKKLQWHMPQDVFFLFVSDLTRRGVEKQIQNYNFKNLRKTEEITKQINFPFHRKPRSVSGLGWNLNLFRLGF